MRRTRFDWFSPTSPHDMSSPDSPRADAPSEACDLREDLVARLAGATRNVVAPRAGSGLAPRVLYGDDAVLAAADFLLAVRAGVHDADHGRGHFTTFGVPKADAGRPLVEVEDVLSVHAVSRCGITVFRWGVGGSLLPTLSNWMQVGAVVHSIERTSIRILDTTWSPASYAIAQG